MKNLEPNSTELAIAPRLELWTQIRGSKFTRLRGEVTGHPVLDDQRIFTSPLLVLDRNKLWARTTSRFYVLGKPAYRPPTELDVARRRRQLQKYSERLAEEKSVKLYTLSDTPNIARAVARRSTATELEGRTILAIMETAHPIEMAALDDAENCLLNQLKARWYGKLF